MRRLNRRDLLKGALLLGLGTVGAGVVLANWPRNAVRRVLETADLPFHARPARYFLPLARTSHCADCHGETAPSRSTFCHVEHRGDYVQCRLCPKGCIIADGRRGDCRTRENRGGTLYTMTYGNPCALHVDPIEKKPFFHFLPGSRAFSLATAGCNLHCLYCQNWEISQIPPEESRFTHLLPAEVVAEAEKSGSASVAFTYAEPTVFYEYMLDTALLARERGLRSVVISAGYINAEPLRALCQAVDAIKIDLKGINEEFYERVCSATLRPVLENIRLIARSGVHLEIVNLVVPSLNDNPAELRALARWVRDEAGPDVPLHFSRFQPQYKLLHLPPTPVESLEEARSTALAEGMRYVYLGNVPGHPGEHTYCPRCGEVIIRRAGMSTVEIHLQAGRCAYCGQEIPGVWK